MITTVSAAVAGHLRDPLRRSSYALIMGTALTSGLGMLFWVVAARTLPAATVGIGAAAFSAMTFLANLSTLGLRNGLVRFLPGAGSSARRLLLGCYALCGLVAALAALIFVIGQPIWADQLLFLRAGPVAVGCFVASATIWVIFVLQDHVLIGLGRAVWVPVANGACAVAKIIILPLVLFSGAWAIFASAVLPAAVAIVVVTVLVLRRLIADATPAAAAVPVSQLVRFAATDHFAALLWLGTADLLTLVVLQQAGAEASAYYFMAATIAYSLFLVTSNVGSALVAEGARHPERTAALARESLGNAARLVIPLAMLGALLAPLVLGFLGADYAANATVLLQLLLLSAMPQMIVGISLSTARIRRDYRMIVGIYAAQAVGGLGGSWVLVGVWGLPGVGLACLGSQCAVAAYLLLVGRTGLWPDRRGWSGITTAVERLPAARRRRRSRHELRRRLAPALRVCGLRPTSTERLLTSDCDTLVVLLEEPPEPLVVKIATSPAASSGLDRHADMITWLRTRSLSDGVLRLLPRVVFHGTAGGERMVVETCLPGETVGGPAPGSPVSRAALATIVGVHVETADRARVGAELIERWVEQPLRVLRGLPALSGDHAGLDRMAEALREALLGREITTSVVHGDFWAGNVLVRPGPEGPQVTGIADWENGDRAGLPDTDLIHWWLAAQPSELGAAVGAALASPALVVSDLSDAGVGLPNPHVAIEHLVLLTWLGHVSAGLTRASRNSVGRVWLTRNVRPVLRLMDGRHRTGSDLSRSR